MYNYRIYKYPLEIRDCQSVEIKGLQRILSTGLDPAGNLCIWALVDTNVSNVTSCRVIIVGTGNPIDPELVESLDDVNWFFGSVTQGSFVWHLFVAP